MKKNENINTIGTLGFHYADGNTIITDYIRKVKILILECTYACFLDNEDYVYIDKKDNTTSVYKAGFGFIIMDIGTTEFVKMNMKDFIAALKIKEDWFFLTVNGELAEVTNFMKNLHTFLPFHNFIPLRICENGNILIKKSYEDIYNVLSPKFTPLFKNNLRLIEDKIDPYAILVTYDKNNEYNIFDTNSGEFVFKKWKWYICRSDRNDYLVWNSPTKLKIYDEDLVLKETKTFDTEEEAMFIEYDF